MFFDFDIIVSVTSVKLVVIKKTIRKTNQNDAFQIFIRRQIILFRVYKR